MKCISAEKGTLYFAFLNIVLVAVSSACSVSALCCWMYAVLMDPPKFLLPKYLGMIFAWMLISFLALIFSSFLLNGSLKRNPHHIKVYYYFGVAFNIAALILIIGFSAFSVPVHSIVLMSAAFAFVAYALVLRMVRHTYQKLESLELTDLPSTCEAAEKTRPPRLAPEDYWEYLR